MLRVKHHMHETGEMGAWNNYKCLYDEVFYDINYCIDPATSE